MTTLTEARDAAGARYAVAVNELTTALIELAAIDVALRNANHAEFDPHLRTFGALPQIVPTELRHPDFSPGPGENLASAVAARADRIIARGV